MLTITDGLEFSHRTWDCCRNTISQNKIKIYVQESTLNAIKDLQNADLDYGEHLERTFFENDYTITARIENIDFKYVLHVKVEAKDFLVLDGLDLGFKNNLKRI